MPNDSTAAFGAARDFLLAHREDYDTAYSGFAWPELPHFNWARDWFDHLATSQPTVAALWMIEPDGSEQRITYAEMGDRSRRLAGWLAGHGIGHGDRVLLVLGNCVPLWELTLACIRLGAVIIPATTLLSTDDLRDRVQRGEARAVVAHGGDTPKFAGIADECLRIAVDGDAPDGWLPYPSLEEVDPWDGDTDTRAG